MLTETSRTPPKEQISAWPPQDVRDFECPDGTLLHRADCRAWIEGFAQHILTVLGDEPRARLHAYQHGGVPWVAVDLFSQTCDDCVAITICLDGKNIDLCASACADQFDLCLPGLADAMAFVKRLSSLVHHASQKTYKTWAASPADHNAQPAPEPTINPKEAMTAAKPTFPFQFRTDKATVDEALAYLSVQSKTIRKDDHEGIADAIYFSAVMFDVDRTALNQAWGELAPQLLAD